MRASQLVHASGLLVLALLARPATHLPSLALAQPTGPNVVYIDTNAFHRGAIDDARRLHAVLNELNALPDGDQPTVITIQSIDSRDTAYGGTTEPFLERQRIISEVAALRGAPAPVFLATEWGTPEDRVTDAMIRGQELPPIFPTSAEELRATGYSWLIDPQGFVVRWDLEGLVPELSASRSVIFGAELVSRVEMIICADKESILGWAGGHQDSRPTDASIGRFTRACINRELSFPESFMLPDQLLEEHDLAGKWFGILLPDAYSIIVDLHAAEATARNLLDRASTEIPLLVAASETLSADFTRHISAEEHATALSELGVSIDADLSRDLPKWVQRFRRYGAVTLVLFSSTGELIGHFAAGPSNPSDLDTLQHALLRLGLL